MPAPQSYKNHAMIDPWFHFVIAPILILNLGIAFALWVNHHAEHPLLALWWIVLSFCFLLMSSKTRIYALRNQDRLIRLEERLRLTALLPAAEHANVHALTTAQLIALRFAPDAEVPSLARRAVAEGLAPNQIKEAIEVWRSDHNRV